MTDVLIYTYKSDNLLEILGLKDVATDAYINDATCTLETLIDEASQETVAGVSLPLTLDYVAASSGDYRATLPDTLDVRRDSIMVAGIQALDTGSVKRYWESRIKVEVDRS